MSERNINYSPVNHSAETVRSLSRSKQYFVFAVGCSVLLAVAVVIVHITSSILLSQSVKELVPPNPVEELPPSPSILHRFGKGVVVSDCPPCAQIGRNIMERNGSAIDVAIATLFCNGLVNSQSMGLGGGFMMTYYDSKTKQVHTLNARETAPMNAQVEMYRENSLLTRRGPLSIGVPGELDGYRTAYLKFGSLPWYELVKPTVTLCESGYNMTKHQYDSLTFNSDKVRADPGLVADFIDKETGQFFMPGSLIRRKKLCETLRLIAELGGEVLYSAELGRKLVEDLQEQGSLITMEDLQSYKSEWTEPISVELNDGNILYSVNPPGGGATLAFIMNVLETYHFNTRHLSTVEQTVLTYHRIVEVFKHAFAQRTKLGDVDFEDVFEIIQNMTSESFAANVKSKIRDDTTRHDPLFYGASYFTPNDRGTAHINVVSTDGSAVSVTSSINQYFGSGITSKQTGITMNSGMDDFSFPYYNNYFNMIGSPANIMKPGKRPMSSMCPTIVLDKNKDLKLVIGAAGGTIMPTAVALVIMRNLWFGQNIKEAIDASRIHHQLYPMSIQYEFGILDEVIKGLEKLGHKTTRSREPSVVNAIAKVGHLYLANVDYRKTGEIYGLD